MSEYDAGREAWRDGAPCPRDPEGMRGWWAARDEYCETVKILNANPPASNEEGFWWNYLAMKQEAKWEVGKA